jgi:hypothetical protein
MKARFSGGQPAFSSAAGDAPQVRSRPGWALGRQFLLQRTEIPVPGAPGSLTIVSAGPQADAYTQHYHDSRGVARWYAMTLAGAVCTLTRESPDVTPLDFPAAFHRHLQRGPEHHQRCLGEGPQRFRLGARLRPQLPQGRRT